MISRARKTLYRSAPVCVLVPALALAGPAARAEAAPPATVAPSGPALSELGAEVASWTETMGMESADPQGEEQEGTEQKGVEEDGPSEERWSFGWKNTFRLTSPDGEVELKFGGRIQNDWTFYNTDDALQARVGELSDGTEFRRARLFFEGELWGTVEFKAQYDFAGGEATFNDVYLGLIHLPGVGGVRVGHYKEPFSLEEHTSSKYLQFVERSLPVEAFSPGRNSGLMLGEGAGGDRLSWHLGVFKDVDGLGEGMGDKWNVTGRVTGLPVYRDGGRRLVHLGLSVSERSPTDGIARFRSRPESHLAPRFVDTGDFAADSVRLVGVEAAVIQGPFSLQGEWIRADADVPVGPDPTFSGAYVSLGWFLTGEHRPYSKSEGGFGRVTPLKSFRHGGTGAWQLAARYSTLDLSDGVIDGGELDDWTLGVNWHLFSNVRTGLDYVHADLHGAGTSESLQMRFQIDF